jgi:hypothetical protein
VRSSGPHAPSGTDTNIDEAERDEPDRLILAVDGDMSKSSLDRIGPTGRLGHGERVALIEREREPCLNIEFAGLVVDSEKFLKFVRTGRAQRG